MSVFRRPDGRGEYVGQRVISRKTETYGTIVEDRGHGAGCTAKPIRVKYDQKGTIDTDWEHVFLLKVDPKYNQLNSIPNLEDMEP